MILLDTTVLSMALRRSTPGPVESKVATALYRMIQDDAPLGVPGVVAQELLSGIKTEQQFALVYARLAGLKWVLAEAEDHVEAGRIYNACLRKGVSPAIVDCLIAALAVRRDAALWAVDQDFGRIAACSDLKMFKPS